MKILKNLFLALIFSALVLNSAQAQLDEAGKRVYQGIAESDEKGDYTQNIFEPFVATSSLILSTKPYKSDYFVGEVFAIELTATTTEKTDFELEVEFNKNDSLVFLNPSTKWQQNGDDYTTTLYFEASDVNAQLAQISVNLKRNKETFQQASLNINPMQFKRINGGKNYSHIVAQELEIKHFKSDFFDDKNLVMIVELAAKNANLKNFKLNNDKIIQQRVDGLRGDFNESSAFYSAVFAPNLNELNFSYFNTTAQRLESVNLRVEVSDEKISTQSDLNPKNNSLDLYKRLALWALAGIFGVFFVLKRHYVLLVAALIFFGASFLVGSSNATQMGVLKANSKAQLLPTTQSTHFYTSETDEEVEILGRRDDYVKVLFSSGKIGWVKNEALQAH